MVLLSLYASQLQTGEDGELFRDAIFLTKPFDNDALVGAVLMGCARREPARKWTGNIQRDSRIETL